MAWTLLWMSVFAFILADLFKLSKRMLDSFMFNLTKSLLMLFVSLFIIYPFYVNKNDSPTLTLLTIYFFLMAVSGLFLGTFPNFLGKAKENPKEKTEEKKNDKCA